VSRHPTRLLGLALTLLGACNFTPYDLGNDDDGTIPRDGGIVLDDGRVVFPADAGLDASACIPSGPDDTCDEVDQDCSGVADDLFDKQNDPSNCGQCGHRCVGAGALQTCTAGACAFVACQPGFADLDDEPLDCEYMCPLFPPIAEECNGYDDDCDGTVDEDLPPPPSDQCRTTAGTPCEGTTMICEQRGAETRWWCDYGPEVEFDASVPNGISLEETRCDGFDGDCDGVVDDTFVDLGQECDDGGVGVCRDVGVRACDPADDSQTTCDLAALPDALPPSAEACDGLDNDCNGTVDDSVGPGRVIDDMTFIENGASDYYIDTYEASHPDATATSTGVSTARSCSKPDVLPWRGVTFEAAQAACAARGATLCSAARWQRACEGVADNAYPYGDDFEAGTCNGERYDGVPGGADDDVLIATGAAAACVADDGPLDMSGNLKEWTDDITGVTGEGDDIAVLRGGAYNTPRVGLACDFRDSRAAVTAVLPTVGFRCCRADAP
jgi:hypothetical protein